MTARDFPWRSPLSVRPPDHSVPVLDQLAEVEGEIARRNAPAGYPALIAKNTLTAEDAALHIAILGAIRDDLADEAWPATYHLALQQGRQPAPRPLRAGPDFAWDLKLREIRRELSIKRNALPRRLASASGTITEADARRILECWDALHWRTFAYLAGFPEGNARLAFIATREADRARGQQWHDQVGEGGGDPGAEWAGIALLANEMARGRSALDIVTAATLRRFHRAVATRAAEAIAAAERTRAGTVERAIAEPQLLVCQLERWLGTLTRRFAPALPAHPQEIAA